MRQQIPKNQQKKQRTTELVEEFTIVRDGQRAFVTYYKLWSIHQKAQTVSPPPPNEGRDLLPTKREDSAR